MSNRYTGKCEDCGTRVSARQGVLERAGCNWVVRCQPCFDKGDHSSFEDRECGDRAYEDRCAAQCGY